MLPRYLTVFLMVLLLPLVAQAGEDDTADITSVFPDGRHRVDLGFSRFDGFDADVDVWLPGYTYSYSRNLRFNVMTSILDVSVPASEELGIPERIEETGRGDSLISVQWDPAGNLTASPWIPKGVGLYTSLIIPTGEKDKGLSLDAYIGEIGAGWLVDLPKNVWLLPSVWYQASFNHGDQARTDRAGAVGLGVYWLFPFRAWIGIEPYLGYDFERDEDIDSIKLVAGKMFSNGFGVDLQWGTQDRAEEFATRDDDVLILNLTWQFGAPPRRTTITGAE